MEKRKVENSGKRAAKRNYYLGILGAYAPLDIFVEQMIRDTLSIAYLSYHSVARKTEKNVTFF